MRRIAAALGAGLGLAAAPASACGLALLLAVDVSSSVDAREYRLQRDGHAAAFRDPRVIAAIRAVGGVRVALVHWSGNPHQEARTPWTTLETEAEISAYGALLGRIERRFDELGTALGAALAYSETAFGSETEGCARHVIDVSGDGVNNTGVDVAGPRARLIARGVTINGLVIVTSGEITDSPADLDPVGFYAREVIGGDGAFLALADGFEDYADAFLEKLLRELGPGVAGLEAPSARQPQLGARAAALAVE